MGPIIILMSKTICSRCEGRGWMRNLSHVQGGECFKCQGAGTVADAATKVARAIRHNAAWIAERKAIVETCAANVAAAPAGWRKRSAEAALAEAIRILADVEAGRV